MKQFDEVGAIMDFENGELGLDGVMQLFSHLVKTGHAWSLQGSYGRMAIELITREFLTREGDITGKHLDPDERR